MNRRKASLSAVLLATAIGSTYEVRFGTAEALLRGTSWYGVKAASRLASSDAGAYRLLAENDPSRYKEYLARSLSANATDAGTWVLLGLTEEAEGNLRGAEAKYLSAYKIDVRPSTTWVLVNFYARQGNVASFVSWGKRYLKYSPPDTSSFFRLAWQMNPDVAWAETAFGPLTCRQMAQLASVLAAEGENAGSVYLEQKTALCAVGDGVTDVERFTSSLIAEDRPADAVQVWTALRGNREARISTVDDNLLTNHDFKSPLTELGFDWRINRTDGVETRQLSSGQGIQFTFSGEQPEHATLLFQPVRLLPGATYRVAARFDVQDTQAISQMRWRLVELSTGKTLEAKTEDSGMRADSTTFWTFDAPTDDKSVVLALSADRPRGFALLNGPVELLDTQLIRQSN